MGNIVFETLTQNVKWVSHHNWLFFREKKMCLYFWTLAQKWLSHTRYLCNLNKKV